MCGEPWALPAPATHENPGIAPNFQSQEAVSLGGTYSVAGCRRASFYSLILNRPLALRVCNTSPMF